MTKVIMNGCNGKMGQTITEICKADADIEIVAGIDLYDGIDNDYPVFSSIDKCDVDADVVIDFSNAKAVDGVLDYCVDKQVPVVLCTTGLSDEQLAKVEECYKKVAVLKSANMSLGINTLMALLKKAAQVFAPAGFDMEIVEKHHNLKLDAPSGTALALADSINEAMDNEYHYVYDRSQRREKRDPKEIGISAVRGGSIVGEHEGAQRQHADELVVIVQHVHIMHGGWSSSSSRSTSMVSPTVLSARTDTNCVVIMPPAVPSL